MKIYRIRDTATGLFSKGGSDANVAKGSSCWSKKGKVWNGLGPLRLHLNMFLEDGHCTTKGIPSTWEVIEYELVETELSAKPVHEILDPKKLIGILKS